MAKLKNTTMEKTVMQKHLEWLKGRMVVSPQMESQLLEEEKKQIIDFADNYGFDICAYDYQRAERYYNETFKQD